MILSIGFKKLSFGSAVAWFGSCPAAIGRLLPSHCEELSWPVRFAMLRDLPPREPATLDKPVHSNDQRFIPGAGMIPEV
ncbi:MAG: hypothetical protein J0J10_05455 [Bosea sp.]|uniref:hypothetical protein n=1 Tax=Bosea sp. (in: a-proteobacteria) TaxID=1871050 RepID=UPI001AC1D54C|nr:hypothetical protein [Bosea sp. (in: a-proteobacteria)]MBN9468203.1 hypothetical protein [Bosea sp. (in: a-proteobacteria)]